MPKKAPKPWWKSLDADDVAEALEEATADCYGDEAISGLVTMAMEALEVPFTGKVLGQVVEIVDVTTASTSDNDLDFVCELGGKQFTIAARSVDLTPLFPDGHLFLAALFDYQGRC